MQRFLRPQFPLFYAWQALEEMLERIRIGPHRRRRPVVRDENDKSDSNNADNTNNPTDTIDMNDTNDIMGNNDMNDTNGANYISANPSSLDEDDDDDIEILDVQSSGIQIESPSMICNNSSTPLFLSNTQPQGLHQKPHAM